MSQGRVYAANALWVASCWPEWVRFQRAAHNVEAAQMALLKRYLRANQTSEYGQRHGFADIHTAGQYQQRAPLTSYDDYAAEIARIGAGSPRILTADPVRMFELSSGSTAASKLIPYTDALKTEFQRGLAPWIYDLYSHIPDLQRGPAYWSITPLTDGQRFTSGGIPIGFEADSAYLGPLGKWLLESVLAVPNSVKILDAENFRRQTLLHLLRQPSLRLISVWNPTFLTLLLESLKQNWDELLNEIAQTNPERASALKAASPLEPQALWPKLRLISCWDDGPAASYARQLQALFPHVTLQGKGLLATEAFVSFPLVGVEGAVLAIHSHFFEFISEAGEALLAHQLQKGQSYSVVVTTGGGLYRYQLHDVVEVVGFWRQIPCIRFVGKADHISDWFGEKLDERFVANTLTKVFANFGMSPTFAMLAPETDGAFCYALYLESDPAPEMLAKTIDDTLRENFHYDYCRKLGQIGPLRVIQVKHGAQTYLAACLARGQKLGNIKPGVLQKTSGWAKQFTTEHTENTEF